MATNPAEPRFATHIVAVPHSGLSTGDPVDYSHLSPHRLKMLTEHRFIKPADPSDRRPAVNVGTDE